MTAEKWKVVLITLIAVVAVSVGETLLTKGLKQTGEGSWQRQALAAFTVLRSGFSPSADLEQALRNHVAEKIGAIAKPDKIFFTIELPKTRSAKIMRRLLRDIAEGKVLGDTTTLSDPAIVASIRQQYEQAEE